MQPTTGELKWKIQHTAWCDRCMKLAQICVDQLEEFDENGHERVAVALSGQTDAGYEAMSDESHQTKTLDLIELTACDLVRIMQTVAKNIRGEYGPIVGPTVADAVI